jgi:hypothetical protein
MEIISAGGPPFKRRPIRAVDDGPPPVPLDVVHELESRGLMRDVVGWHADRGGATIFVVRVGSELERQALSGEVVTALAGCGREARVLPLLNLWVGALQ